MSFLLPLMFSIPSLGTTPILDMVPPRDMQGMCLEKALIDVLGSTNSVMDFFHNSTSSNSLLWSQFDWAQSCVHVEVFTDFYLNATGLDPPINNSLFSPPISYNLDVKSMMGGFVYKPPSVFMHDFLDFSTLANASQRGGFDWLSKWPDELIGLLMPYLMVLLYALQSSLRFDRSPSVYTLMLVTFLLPVSGTLCLIFDGTLAIIGLTIYIAGLCPFNRVVCARIKPISECKSYSVSACSALITIAKHTDLR